MTTSLVPKQPNWKNSEDYAYAEALKSKRAWAWEFLRRSSSYREAYKKYEKKALKYQKQYGDEWRINPATYCYFPRKKEGESYKRWMIRVSGQGKLHRRMRLDQCMGRKFFLKSMYDPLKGYDQGVKFLRVTTMPELIYTADQFHKYTELQNVYYMETDEVVDDLFEVPSKYAVLVFDVSQDLKHQIETARSFLNQRVKILKSEGFKTENVRITTVKWVRHLRVLDAFNLENPPDANEILNVLGYSVGRLLDTSEYPGKIAFEYKEAAKEMADKGYIKILRSAERSKK